MSKYYRGKRSRNIYDPADPAPFKLSRSKLEAFMNCPRCFYIDRRLGVGQPPGYPFNLNSAVDALLKNEFDIYRAQGKPHPLMVRNRVDAVPAAHEKLDEWRENFKGVQHLHGPTNLIITGAIDDLWINPAGEYIVVDYKATSKSEAINELDQDWHDGYKRQMEIYQWLLRRNGLTVSDTGYFVYCNGIKDRDLFDARLDFEITLIPHVGNDGWVENCVHAAHACLGGGQPPSPAEDCDYCVYLREVESALGKTE